MEPSVSTAKSIVTIKNKYSGGSHFYLDLEVIILGMVHLGFLRSTIHLSDYFG